MLSSELDTEELPMLTPQTMSKEGDKGYTFYGHRAGDDKQVDAQKDPKRMRLMKMNDNELEKQEKVAVNKEIEN